MNRLRPRQLWIGLAAAVLCGCHVNDGLRGGNGHLAAPPAVDFGSLYLGAQATQEIDLRNDGTAGLQLGASAVGDDQVSIAGSMSFDLLAGSHTSILVALAASRLGAVHATVRIGGDAALEIPLTAVIVPDLDCPPPGPCLSSAFDPNRGTCQVAPTQDGQSCNDGNLCTTSKVCEGGACKGVSRGCDDSNVCTVDYCSPATGCQHLDETAACNGSDPCQVYYCDPKSGCQSSPAVDGTPCATEVPCVTATFCLLGRCTGVPIPDGQKCVSPRDPCATDGKCKSGQCDSPTADALKPGDILWQKVAAVFRDGDGGASSWNPDGSYPSVGGGGTAVGWRAAAASDALGNLYLDDVAFDGGGDLVSLDQCGKDRWRVAYPSSAQWFNGRHLLVEGLVLSVGSDQTLAGQSQTTGLTLWTFDPRPPPSPLTQILPPLLGFTVEDVALSRNGVLYYTAQGEIDDLDGGTWRARFIGGVLRNGQSKFQTELPRLPLAGGLPSFGYPLLVDENENLYTAMTVGNDSAEIESYDQTGAARFALPVARSNLNSFSENGGFFVEPTSVTAFDAQGNVAWSRTESSTLSSPDGHSPVVSLDGHATLSHYREDLSEGIVENLAPDGTTAWTLPLGPSERVKSSLVLGGQGAQGTIYFVTNQWRLLAVDQSRGNLSFQTLLPSTAPPYEGVLALTPAGSLIASVGERLVAVFAGAPLSSGPWPRFRGGNDNASTPAIQSPGPLP